LKLLLYDLEIAMNISAHYDRWNTNIPYKHTLHPKFLISASWQWFDEDGKNKVHNTNLLKFPKAFKEDFRNDYHVIERLHREVDQADCLLAFNGDGFDIKYFHRFCEKHNLPFVGHKPSIDPFKIAKRHFKFESNGLDNLCDYLGIERKIATSDDLFFRASMGERKAIKEMAAYNDGDIDPTLRDLYIRLRKYLKNHPSMNAYKPGFNCRTCGSDNLIIHKHRKLAGSQLKTQYLCKNCGSYMTPTKAEHDSRII